MKKYSMIENIGYLFNNNECKELKLAVCILYYSIARSVFSFIPVIVPKLLLDSAAGGEIPLIITIVSVSGFLFLTMDLLESFSYNRFWPGAIKMRFSFIAKAGARAMAADFKNTESEAYLDLFQKAKDSASDNSKGIAGMYIGLLRFIPSVISCIGFVYIILFLNPLFNILLILAAVLNFMASRKIKETEFENNQKIAPITRGIEYFTEVMTNFKYGKEIRVFDISGFIINKYSKLAAGIMNLTKITESKKSVAFCIQKLIGVSLELSIYVYLIFKVSGGEVSFADFVLFTTSVKVFSVKLTDMLTQYSQIWKCNKEINVFRQLMDLPDEMNQSVPGTVLLAPTSIQSIEFKNVSFKYPESGNYTLKNISLKVNGQEKVSIAGFNGAGKTTLIKLLMRLYDVTDGEILLNGINIKEYDLNSYYGLFSVVFQDVRLYAMPVSENISFCRSGESNRDRILGALETSGLRGKIMSLDNNIETQVFKIIDENGTEFSGGESQSLAFSRAAYKNAPIIVLDEPTSALDPSAEDEMIQRIDDFTKGKNSFFISHRLSSAKTSDVIIVMNNGSIAESGSYSDLMERKGILYELVSKQAVYYSDPFDSKGGVSV